MASIILGVIFGILAFIVLFIIVTFNSLIMLRNRVDNAWSQIDVQLKRRYDLIPNLVNAVKGYIKHERQFLPFLKTIQNCKRLKTLRCCKRSLQEQKAR